MSEPIRVFCGTEPKTIVAHCVLESSIKRRTRREVLFTPMLDDPAWQYPPTLKTGTGFSLRRWLIPAYCAWEGRAIYLDADQIVLSDIEELWQMPETVTVKREGEITPVPAGTAVWATYQADKFSPEVPRPQSSVMVIDCAAAWTSGFGWRKDYMLDYLVKNPSRYHDFMHAFWLEPPPARIPNVWNALHTYTDKTKLLHFTKEPNQPWYAPDRPLSHLWEKELKEAIIAGYVTREDFESALSKWKRFEDHRRQNGLNPHYKRYLSLF